MLGFIIKNEDDLIKKINNGLLQKEIYDYLDEITINDDLYEYFEAEINNIYYSYEDIETPTDSISLTLNILIKNVYERFLEEKELERQYENSYEIDL